MDELKNYRAPRSHWVAIMAVVALVGHLGIVGPIHYASDIEVEAELKVLRAELAAKRLPQSQIAPIRQRCPDQRKQQFYAWQKDGGRWNATCIDGYLKIKEQK